MSNIPSPGQIYRHFKGNLYRIVTLAEDSETGNMLVIYQALYGQYKVYARPLSMFVERLDKRRYPDAEADFRFELQKELIEIPAIRQGEAWQDMGSADFGGLPVKEKTGSAAVQEPDLQVSIREREPDVKIAVRQQHGEQEPDVRIPARQQETEQEAAAIRDAGEARPQEKLQENELNIDPLVLEFLDARTHEERLKILSRLRPRITDSMINVMSIAVDVEVKDGDLEDRFDQLRACLSTRQRYESRSSRLR